MVSAQMPFSRSKGGFRRWLGRDAIAEANWNFPIKNLTPIQRLDTKLDMFTAVCVKMIQKSGKGQDDHPDL